MTPIVRAIDIGFGSTKYVRSSQEGKIAWPPSRKALFTRRSARITTTSRPWTKRCARGERCARTSAVSTSSASTA